MIARDVFLRGLEMIHSVSMLTVQEATFLYEFAASFDRPITWFELGVWCGRGYWSAGCGLPSQSTLIGVDAFTGQLPEREGSAQIVQFAPCPRLQFLQFTAVKSSLEYMVPQLNCGFHRDFTHNVAPRVSHAIDVLVVDAAHDYESVKQDLADWLPKMRPGGTVLCHDYTDKYPGVRNAVDEVACHGDEYRDFCRVRGTRFARIDLYEQAAE